MPSVFIVGCGDIGLRITRFWPLQRFTGLVRSPESLARLKEAGVDLLQADLDSGEGLGKVQLDDRMVFYLAPPPAQGDQDPRMRRFLAAISGQRPKSLIYISTSGVYGDCGGAWVTEDWPARPFADRAKRRWDAEQQLLAWSEETGVPVVRLRVGGIYAPDRLPVARIKQGLTVICPDEAPWSNRIHADDLARVCIAAAEKGAAGAIYNAADGHPTTMTDYFYQVADFLGLERPHCVPLDQATSELSPAMLSFIRESRRLDITRMLTELEVSLQYPELRAGLAALVSHA